MHLLRVRIWTSGIVVTCAFQNGIYLLSFCGWREVIPIRNESPRRGVPVVTVLIILACMTVFALQMWYFSPGGLVPLDFVYSLLHPTSDLPQAVKALVLSFFLHGGIIHLLSNMWYLWIFGAIVESSIGARRFAMVYLSCGVLSMLIQVASSPLSSVPIVGASGAIAGIMGLNLVWAPMARILVWFPPIFVFRVPAFIFLLLWFAVQYMSMGRDTPGNSSVAWWAHIGGYASGVVFAFLLRNRKRRAP